jgi:hypothetical protein
MRRSISAVAGGSVLTLALLLAACGGVRSGANLCALVPAEDAAAALGVGLAEAVPQAGDHAQCEWRGAAAGDGLPRKMNAALWRESALRRADPRASGALFFEDQLKTLEKDFPETRVLGAGDASVIGFGDVGDERFTGAILVRKGGDVLTMRIEGADPAAFEAAARRIVDEM